VIRRVVGAVDLIPSLGVLQLQGLTWPQFVEHYADDSAREGLNAAWLAMAEKCVAPAYWPPHLPFKPGVIARLRPLENDPIISFVVHLSTAGDYDLLNNLIGTYLLNGIERTVRVSQNMFRGMDGPLTDRQVKSLRGVISHAEHTRALLEDLRAAVLLPAATAPLPHPLQHLLAFSLRDFNLRRITTQRLALHSTLSAETVYCYAEIRDVMQRMIGALLAGIAAESAITVTDTVQPDTVRIDIAYRSQETSLQTTQRIEPLDLSDLSHWESMGVVQRWVTAAQARLKPVNGRAWAEPHPDAAHLVLVLPRWKGTLPGKSPRV
jgi:hypothetical protein